MAGGPARFKQGFSCPVLLDKTHIRSASFLHTRLSRSLASHSNYSANHAVFSPHLLLIASSHKPDTSILNIKFSGLVVCNITTPYKHSPISLFACEQAKTCKVWALPVSLATTPRIVIYFLFLNLLRCFSSVGSRSLAYIFSKWQHDSPHAGFPHSEISGSKLVGSYPKLIAVFHVLHR